MQEALERARNNPLSESNRSSEYPPALSHLNYKHCCKWDMQGSANQHSHVM